MENIQLFQIIGLRNCPNNFRIKHSNISNLYIRCFYPEHFKDMKLKTTIVYKKSAQKSFVLLKVYFGRFVTLMVCRFNPC